VVSIQRNTSRRLLTLHNNTGSSTKRKANPEFLIQTIYKSKCQNHTTLLSYILCTILHCSTQTAKDLHSSHYFHFAWSYSVVFYVAFCVWSDTLNCPWQVLTHSLKLLF